MYTFFQKGLYRRDRRKESKERGWIKTRENQRLWWEILVYGHGGLGGLHQGCEHRRWSRHHSKWGLIEGGWIQCIFKRISNLV